MTITVNGQTLATDNEGFLLDPADWSREAAEHIAQIMNIKMTEAHWVVINFVREHFEQSQSVPEARHCLKALRESLGQDKATRKFLYSLFPYGYGQQACKIAGMRKPLKLMLDV
jgi:TusE/DsrC/DsvC family sulfur relay protein